MSDGREKPQDILLYSTLTPTNLDYELRLCWRRWKIEFNANLVFDPSRTLNALYQLTYTIF